MTVSEVIAQTVSVDHFLLVSGLRRRTARKELSHIQAQRMDHAERIACAELIRLE
jgi:hypothetical protein